MFIIFYVHLVNLKKYIYILNLICYLNDLFYLIFYLFYIFKLETVLTVDESEAPQKNKMEAEWNMI